MCRSHLAPIFVLAALPLAASAELVQSGVCVGELYGLSSNPDGVVHDNEYGSDPFTGYGTGAGSLLSRPIQSPVDRQILFNLRPSESTFSIALRAGASLGDKAVIVLLNTREGGRSAGSGLGITSINDSTDATRRAMSMLQGTYPTGNDSEGNAFLVDFAITFNSGGVGIFAFPDDAGSMFTQIGGYGDAMDASSGVGEGQWNSLSLYSSIGEVFSRPVSFAVVIADDSGLCNESVPEQPFNAGPNPGHTTTAIPNFAQIGIFIPAPSGALLLVGAACVTARRCR